MVATLLPSTIPLTPAAAGRAARASAAKVEARHDVTLVKRFNSGDETAFIEIVERHREKLFAIALGLLRNRADAEEIAQDAFVRAYRALGRFRGDASLATWLHRIVLNLARNRYWYLFRRRQHATLPLDAPFAEGKTATFGELLASDAPSPAREAANVEFARIISRCMELLASDQKEILTLRNVHHHSYSEIGQRLGVNLGTVKSRIARARGRLRSVLAEAYPDCPLDLSSLNCFEVIRPAGFLDVAVH
jgi:RNA polymerase sigma-70 factor (ECF subfamily)